MDFELKSVSLTQAFRLAVDTLIVPIPDDVSAYGNPGDPLTELIAQALRLGDLEDGVGKHLAFVRPVGFKARRVVLVRSGKCSPADIRKAMTAVASQLKQAGIQRAALVLSGIPDAASALTAALPALAEALYVYTHTKPSAKPASLRSILVAVASVADARAAFEHACAISHGSGVAREWANRPANHSTPAMLAEAARTMARKSGLECQVLGAKEVRSLGMGAFLAVAQASAEPLKFIVLRYKGAARDQAPVVLVGKGITFDTGGISLKPAPEMDEMKFDMSGAASVLGTFAALARLKPLINVVGLIPACENMPGGSAVKPGDVVTSMSGQTIEVLNTDAEGRLILCDALTYAERFKPRAVVDIATLTGACVIALGGVRTGLFATDDDLAQAMLKAGEASLDLCWRMPMDDEYAEGLKSNFADMGNVAGRAAGSVTAAKFLQKFAGKYPWAHLDIAGTAWRSGVNKGATGRPVPLLVQYLVDQAAQRTKRAVGRKATASQA